jgi:hypothetical protein
MDDGLISIIDTVFADYLSPLVPVYILHTAHCTWTAPAPQTPVSLFHATTQCSTAAARVEFLMASGQTTRHRTRALLADPCPRLLCWGYRVMRRFSLNIKFDPYCNPRISTTMSPIEAAIEDFKSLPHDVPFAFTMMGKKHGVVRSTLIRRHRAETKPRSTNAVNQQKLTLMQEEELIDFIHEMNQRSLPPRSHMVRNWALAIAKKVVGYNWVYAFLNRHPNEVVLKWTTSMDSDLHKADSRLKHERYFTYWHSKMEEYQLEPENIYNMDGKRSYAWSHW